MPTLSESDIVYRDADMIVINKPAGLLVHRSPINRSEKRFAVQEVRNLNGGKHVHPVHRIDKPTSGLLVFAFERDMAAELSASFSSREVKKTYLALIRGFCPEEGQVEKPLKDMHDKVLHGSNKDDLKTREALTRYMRLATTVVNHQVEKYPQSRYSLVRISPETGRKHQIRRHFNHIAHPIIGDGKHGDHRHNKFFKNTFGLERMMLHAWKLEFQHPRNGKPISLGAAPDDAFSGTLAAIGISTAY